MRRLLFPLAFVLMVATARAATVGDVGAALRSDPVYVEPDAEAALTREQADALRSRIRDADAGPVYVAILPQRALEIAGGSPDALLSRVRAQTGRNGTYVLVRGRHLVAGSDLLSVSGIADQALAEHRDEGLPAILNAFVDDVASARGARGGGGGGGGGGDGSGLLILGAVVLGGAGLALASRRRRRRDEAEQLAAVKHQVRDELVELGEGIGRLDIDTQLNTVAQNDYGRAVEAYDRANTAWNSARTVEDLAPVGAALEEGRWALAATQARLEGREPPERRAPCFFDPRHGPSSRDVVWAPPGGAPREVPACEADAQRVERGIEPEFRQLAGVPYWEAGPMFSPSTRAGCSGGSGSGPACSAASCSASCSTGPTWPSAAAGATSAAGPSAAGTSSRPGRSAAPGSRSHPRAEAVTPRTSPPARRPRGAAPRWTACSRRTAYRPSRARSASPGTPCR